MHWRSRGAACLSFRQQHTARTRWLGTLTASVALTLKVCGGPGGWGLDPAQPQRPAPDLATGHPDLSPTRNHTAFSHRPASCQSPERAQWFIHQARSLFDEQTQSKPQAPGFREEKGLRAGRLSLCGPTGQESGLIRGSSYTQLGEEGAPNPQKDGGVSCSHHVSLLIQEGAEGLLGILLRHPRWAVQHSHPQNADQGGQPALPERPPGLMLRVSDSPSAKK